MDADEVLATKKYLRVMGEWPPVDRIDAKKWLAAFHSKHKDFAVALLDAFVFISDRQVTKLFINAIHSISEEISQPAVSYEEKRALWNIFLQSAVFTAPTGEDPNPTDSGHIFQRLARTEIGIEEERIVIDTSLREVVEYSGPAPLIFVDDFAGSGEQFLTTWNRQSWQGYPATVAQLAEKYKLDVYYIPLICTEYAAKRIASEAPSVRIRAPHILTEVYCATDSNTIVFPEELRAEASQFVDEASENAGIDKWRYGFHELALSLAFEHSIPDACVAILWSEEGGWVPLMAKR
ncbi:phosphoribosyltransferase-like protein [Mycobacteroides chelonae]|uniref:phosphoribosyltransferase-like protein n=1 Tax=Mycobacteroides chelonae TaxID=1774 RepID=UPI001041E6C6|nr:hypothetical protein [Mycobacteroides chelonae]